MIRRIRFDLPVPHPRLIGVVGLILALAGGLTAARADSGPSIQLQAYQDVIRVQAQAEEVEQLRLQVYGLSGQKRFDSGLQAGRTLDWRMTNDRGRKLAHGVYLYRVEARDAHGNVRGRQTGKLVIRPDRAELSRPSRTDGGDLVEDRGERARSGHRQPATPEAAERVVAQQAITSDGGALVLQVNGDQALRVAPSDDGTFSPNLIGGHPNNQVDDTTDGNPPIVGATIGGGGASSFNRTKNTVGEDFATVGGGSSNIASGAGATVGGGDENTASGSDATVGGGRGNTSSGQEATVGGGDGNTASGSDATVGGGRDNTSSSSRATVGGGRDNTASGTYATVGGGRLNIASDKYATVPGGLTGVAEDNHAFVWNDGTEYHSIPKSPFDGLSSSKAVDGEPVTGANTFSVSATGGVRFITGSASSPKVTYIPGDSAGWTTISSRESKTNIQAVEPQQVLAGVAQLNMHTWEYKGEDGQGAGVRHLGPMAGDFHKAIPLELGSSEAHINSINLDGVALTAIQALYERNEQLQQSNAELKQQVEQLEAQNEAILQRLEELEAEVATDE